MRQAHTIVITIETSNDAFERCERGEVSRILRHLCSNIGAEGVDAFLGQNGLYEINGNTCGKIEVEPDK